MVYISRWIYGMIVGCSESRVWHDVSGIIDYSTVI